MAFDAVLADRVRSVLKRRSGVRERKMFGGLCFTIHGNMCCGVAGQDLVLRLGESDAQQALREPYTRLMDFTGTPMKSMVYVSRDGYAAPESLRQWVLRAVTYCQSLPKKEPRT